MRVLLATSIFSTPRRPRSGGGSDAVVQKIVSVLRDRGHDVQLLRAAAPPITVPEDVSGMLVHDVPAPNIYHWQGAEERRDPLSKALWHLLDDRGPAAARVGAIFDAFRPDVFVTHNLSGLGPRLWSIARARSVPIVHTLHDYHLLCAATTRRRGEEDCQKQCQMCTLLTAYRRNAALRIDRFISVSAHVAEVHRKWGAIRADAKVRVIHNAVSQSLQRRVPQYDGRRPLRLGFIGRGSVNKGLPLLLDAFADLKAPAELWVAGVVEPEARAKINAHPRRAAIKTLGFVDPAEFYPLIDLVVVPSLSEEAFGLPCVEAQAYGCAVAGSEKGGIPEAIGGRAHGWLFDPAQPEHLVRVLAEAAACPATLRSFAEAGIAKSHRYNIRDFGDAHEAVLLDAARSG